MATKYHKTPDGLKPCSATKRQCKYLDASADEIAQFKANGVSPDAGVANPFVGIKLNPSGIPRPWSDYEYDSYSCSGCHGCDTGDDYCRGSVYEGLRMEPIVADNLLNQIFKKEPQVEYPKELYVILENSGILDTENWEVEADWDYYGQTVTGPTFTGENPYPQIVEYYSSKYANAMEDTGGYMSYIRELGYETTPGVDADQAVKDYVLTLDVPASVKHHVLTSNKVTEVNWKYLYSKKRTSSELRKKAQKENRFLNIKEKENEIKILSNPKAISEANIITLPAINTKDHTKTPILGIFVKNKANNSYFLVTGHDNYRTLKFQAKNFASTKPEKGLENYRFIIID